MFVIRLRPEEPRGPWRYVGHDGSVTEDRAQARRFALPADAFAYIDGGDLAARPDAYDVISSGIGEAVGA